MDATTEATEATFNALAQLRALDPDAVGSKEFLHQQLATLVEQAYRSARKLGLSDRDAEDIRYALVALVDETVLARGGELRDFWLPRTLQLQYFNDNRAGDAFFERLANLRGDRTRAHVLRVYYLCLLLGFRGKYRTRGGELEIADILDELRKELRQENQIDKDRPLSPHGPRPHEPLADRQRNALLIWLAVAAAAASVLLYIGLQLSLISRTTELVQRLSAASGG